MLQARFITDLEKYNEWMNEEDYIVGEDDDDDDDEAERGDAEGTQEVALSSISPALIRAHLCLPRPRTRACRECFPICKKCAAQDGNPNGCIHWLRVLQRLMLCVRAGGRQKEARRGRRRWRSPRAWQGQRQGQRQG